MSFRIVSGNELGHFGVKSFPSFGSNSVGQIIVEKELDFETPPNLYELNILAYNANATNIDDKRYQVGIFYLIKTLIFVRRYTVYKFHKKVLCYLKYSVLSLTYIVYTYNKYNTYSFFIL